MGTMGYCLLLRWVAQGPITLAGIDIRESHFTAGNIVLLETKRTFLPQVTGHLNEAEYNQYKRRSLL